MDDAAEGSVPALMAGVAGLLFAHGQTTEATRLAVERLGAALGHPGHLAARWDELTIWREHDAIGWRHAVQPLAVDIGRVLATEHLVDKVCDGSVDVPAAVAALPGIGRQPPVSLIRFAVMAAAGAAALAIIFGAADALTLAIIAGSAGLGACLRRAVSHFSGNAFAQPFVAALLAGAIGSATIALALPVSYRLVAVCPCMVLVPGPHFLNGMIDLARARIPLGAARFAFASLVALAISAGLLVGLAAATTTLPEAAPTGVVPLLWDVGGAGVAVAAYAAFFNMPWRTVPIPICVGMSAHALRWELLDAGASPQLGAFVACLLVGSVMTLVSHRFRMPFGALAFASVVSLIPGVFMFQAASAALQLIDLGPGASPAALTGLIQAGATASIILLAMAAGLIIPRLCFDAKAAGSPHR